jgi:HK97 gp10 family phage protein
VADTKNLTGFKELADALKQLPQRVARKHLRGSTAKGATVIRKAARDLAPVDTGEMRKDIQIKRERTSGDHVASYSVYTRGGKRSRLAGKARNVDKDSFYWKFVEFGTAKMAAQPFMRPAFEANKEAAVDALGEELDKRIQKEATDLARGQ